jgi:hypothetical protein
MSSSLTVLLVAVSAACYRETAATSQPSAADPRSASASQGRTEVLDASIITEGGPGLEAGLADLDSIIAPR